MSKTPNTNPGGRDSSEMPDLVRDALDRAHELADRDHQHDTGTWQAATHVGDMSVAAVALTEHRQR